MANIKHPSRTLVMGKSQSGKTTMAVSVVEALLPSIKHLVVCSPTYKLQPTWQTLRGAVELHCDCLTNLTPVIEKYVNGWNGEPGCIVLDDVSGERALNEGSRGPLNQIAYNAVWLNISLVVICHRISNVGSGVRENVEHLLLFQTISEDQIKALADNYSITGVKKDFIFVYKTLVTDRVLDGNKHAFMYLTFADGTKIYEDFNREIKLQ